MQPELSRFGICLPVNTASILALRPLMEATTRAERLAALAASPLIETPLLHAVTVALPQSGEFLTYEARLRATLYRDIQVRPIKAIPPEFAGK